jgi:hypothetical protein
MTTSTMTNKCTSIVGHFDGHGGAPGQYRQHCPIRHVQGYLRSHWTPPLDNYLLCIAPVAARAAGEQTTINKYTYFAGHFNGHGNALVRNHVHCPMEEVQASLEATGRYHWASIMSNNIKGTWLRWFIFVFHRQNCRKFCGSMLRPLFSIGVCVC